MNIKNNPLEKIIKKEDSELKELIVEFVGKRLNPENKEITVENIVEIFSEQFPEFLIATAEENWINGYTQALNDIQFVEKQKQAIKGVSLVE